MKLFGIARVCLGWWLVLSISWAADQSEAFNDQGEGAAQVKELLLRVPSTNSQVLGTLKIRSAEGPITEVPIKLVIRIEGRNWEDLYETQPVGGRPGEVLIVRHRGLEPSEYFFGRYQKSGDKVQLTPLTGPRLYQPLAGSDFFLADLGLEFLHWPSQKIIKKEMRKSRSCRVIESINPTPRDGGYSRVLSWIDFETGHLIMAEAYDAKDKLLKEFSVRSVDRKEGKLREIEMRNDQTDTRTRLLLNLDIDRE